MTEPENHEHRRKAWQIQKQKLEKSIEEIKSEASRLTTNLERHLLYINAAGIGAIFTYSNLESLPNKPWIIIGISSCFFYLSFVFQLAAFFYGRRSAETKAGSYYRSISRQDRKLYFEAHPEKDYITDEGKKREFKFDIQQLKKIESDRIRGELLFHLSSLFTIVAIGLLIVFFSLANTSL